MKATGVIKIEEGLELKDPKMEILKVNYDWINYSVAIEVSFTEGVYKHCRTYEFNVEPTGEMTTNDIMELIKTHNILNKFY